MMEIRVKLGGEDAEDYKLGQSLLEVKILAVGDDEVIISGLEDYENTRVILNLSIR